MNNSTKLTKMPGFKISLCIMSLSNRTTLLRLVFSLMSKCNRFVIWLDEVYDIWYIALTSSSSNHSYLPQCHRRALTIWRWNFILFHMSLCRLIKARWAHFFRNMGTLVARFCLTVGGGEKNQNKIILSELFCWQSRMSELESPPRWCSAV